MMSEAKELQRSGHGEARTEKSIMMESTQRAPHILRMRLGAVNQYKPKALGFPQLGRRRVYD